MKDNEPSCVLVISSSALVILRRCWFTIFNSDCKGGGPVVVTYRGLGCSFDQLNLGKAMSPDQAGKS